MGMLKVFRRIVAKGRKPLQNMLRLLTRCKSSRNVGRFGSISFHCIELMYAAYRARDAARIDSQRPNALPTDALAAVVMSVIAAEAFINEFPETIRWAQSSHGNPLVTPAMAKCADVLEESVRLRDGITKKYQAAALALSGSRFNAGREPFQDFRLLVDIRNEIVHLKPAWSEGVHQGRKLTVVLEKRNLTAKSSLPWINKLEDTRVATWACETVRAMILAVLAFTPDGTDFTDPFDHMKWHLRNDERFPP